MRSFKPSKTFIEITSFVIIFGLVIFLWWSSWGWIDDYIFIGEDAEKSIAARGQFGDKFGAINSLFSGFAFAGIIITLVLQRRDLEATRNAMGQERIDSTFFQLLQLHTDITSKLKISGGPSGIEALVAYDEHLKNADDDFVVFQALQKIDDGAVRAIRDRRSVAPGVYPELTASDVANLNNSLATGISSFDNYLDQNLAFHERKIVAAYTSVAAQHIDSFSHYFRNLYNIFKFIDESKLVSENDKKTYAKFVRSQLSDIELVCLFYNSISKIDLPGRAGMELGYPKMYAYLKKYDILQNMNPRSLIHPRHQLVFDSQKV